MRFTLTISSGYNSLPKIRTIKLPTALLTRISDFKKSLGVLLIQTSPQHIVTSLQYNGCFLLFLSTFEFCLKNFIPTQQSTQEEKDQFFLSSIFKQIFKGLHSNNKKDSFLQVTNGR